MPDAKVLTLKFRPIKHGTQKNTMCEVSVKDPEAFYMSLQGKIKRNIMVISPPAGLLDSILDCSALKKKRKKGQVERQQWLIAINYASPPRPCPLKSTLFVSPYGLQCTVGMNTIKNRIWISVALRPKRSKLSRSGCQ